MKRKIEVVPTVSVNDLAFGCDRETVRKRFGKKYKEVKKSIYAKNTMDVYDSFYVYYSDSNSFEAIEVFGDTPVVINKAVVFPGNVEALSSALPNLKKDDYGMTDKKNSISVTIDPDSGSIIDSILIGKRGYYDEG